MPLLQIFAGSESDEKAILESGMLDILNATVGLRNYGGVSYCSAHRDPDELAVEVKTMMDEGAHVFIGIAGMAAALPGALAGATRGAKLVIAVPLDEHGVDSCLYMPPGRPVALAGVGKSGLVNAAILAAQALSHWEGIGDRLADYQAKSKSRKAPRFNVWYPPKPVFTGKVRDTYDIPRGRLLQVASDRISVFDVVLEETIPGKGRVLTSLTEFWLGNLSFRVPNHLVTTNVSGLHPALQAIDDLEGRGLLVRKCRMLPIECIVRGYLYGSVVKEYDTHGTACGIKLPPGLKSGSRLPEPIFTPSTKAELGENDENITLEVGRRLLKEAGFDPDIFDYVARESIGFYIEAAAYAAERGIIIADTKFEFGLDDFGVITLCDEVLTPDSSRFWDKAAWDKDGSVVQFDKQVVRDYYKKTHPDWNKKAPAPPLPKEVIDEIARKYRQIQELLVGG